MNRTNVVRFTAIANPVHGAVALVSVVVVALTAVVLASLETFDVESTS